MSEKDLFARFRGTPKKDSLKSDTCVPGLMKADPLWQPKSSKRRIEVIVTGDPHRVGIVRESVNEIQKQLFGKSINSDDLEMRITAFLDGCRHSTPWGKKPTDVGAGTTRWHCYQDKTLFIQALAQSNKEASVDAILIYGDRFDDKLAATLAEADKLKANGTKIYALHVGDNIHSKAAFTELAQYTGGICLQLTDQSALNQVLPVMTDYIMRGDKAFAELQAPADPNIQLLVDSLRDNKGQIPMP